MDLSMYSCIANLTLKFAKNHAKQRLGSVSFSFSYENCGFTKRRVFPRPISSSESRAVIIGTKADILSKKTLINFIADCPRLYIVTEFGKTEVPLRLQEHDDIWAPSTDFLINNYVNETPLEGKTYFYCEDSRDASHLGDKFKFLTVTSSDKYLPWCKYSLVYSDENLVKSVLAGCHPFCWKPINSLARRCYDLEYNYVDSNSFSRCYDFIDLMGKCQVLENETRRKLQLGKLEAAVREEAEKQSITNSRLYTKLFNFCIRR